MSWNTLLVEKRGHTACVTLNRPEVLNSVSIEMMRELKALYQELEDDEDVWTIIVTGAGNKALCTGADVNVIEGTMRDGQPTGIDMWGEPMLSSYRQWDIPQEATPPYMTMTKPIICAINGIACGAGLDLVTTCDISIAADHASFFDPHVSIGVVSAREMVRVARVLPLPVAMRMAIMGKHERISAQRAYELGFITEVVPGDQLMERAWEVAEIVNRNAPLAVRGTRMAIRKGYSLPIYEAELLAESYRMRCAQTEDAVEGPAAFLEKRRPEWKGR
ncbi:enoyl-CoA hydratase/isomerase family protein [Novosphingobium bradum]|uniref:Enoyl-CoA hydratase/isomerase family protein n=1 Tax=Novosphingobium bradum TaxID=1737444 RepID=A0ABV7IIY8_9SPHN